ncbi:MAG: PEGA domain-containing protein [Deltaproteobacteria bacterium]|nr:PEGA domain-containing protein [Deltaproteobacteria bacterium]
MSVGLALVLGVGSAWAQQPGAAIEQQHRRGIAMLRQGQNEQALAVFREIYERTREPRALWRMATAEAALGRWVEAEGHMSSAFGSTSDAWIRAERAGLEATLRQVQARVGLLTVRCNVAGASIEVDGRAVTSFPLRVVAGDVRVLVRAEGYQEAEATVSVPGNVERAYVQEVELRPIAGVRRGEVPENSIGGANEVLQQPRRPAPSSELRTGGIIALSAGAAGQTGVVGLVLRNSAATRFNDNPACGMSGGGVDGGTVCSDDVATTNTMQTVSLVGFIAGGVLAATGAVLLIAAPAHGGSERASTHGSTIRLASGPGQIGIGIGGNW